MAQQNLSEAIVEGFNAIGLDCSGKEMKEWIAKHIPHLTGKLDTGTFSSTFSTKRSKLREKGTTGKAATKSFTELEAPTTTTSVSTRTPIQATTSPTNGHTSGSHTCEEKPVQVILANFADSYRELVKVFGSEIAATLAQKTIESNR